MYQALGVGAGVAGDDYSDTRRGGEVVPPRKIRSTETADNSVADASDGVVIANVSAQHDELVASQAGHGIAAPGQARSGAALPRPRRGRRRRGRRSH